MNIPDHPSRIRRMRDARLNKLAQAGPLVAASLVTMRVRCGTPTCRCQRGQKHLKYCLTFKQDGKTRTVYIPLDLLPEVREWVAEHKRTKRLLKEISDLTIALIRTHAAHRDPRRSRRPGHK